MAEWSVPAESAQETWPEWKNPVPAAMLMSGMRKTEGPQMTER